MIVLDLETIGIPDAASIVGEGDIPALIPPLARIVCAGVLNERDAKAISGEESAIVSNVFSYLSDTNRWPLVTFNGRRFDLPVLMAAALRHKLKIPRDVLTLMTEYRYAKIPNHVDLWDVLTNFGAFSKGGLRAWCVGLGLGDPKKDCDGSNIESLFAAGNLTQIEAYCLDDCRFTHELYKRYLECVR